MIRYAPTDTKAALERANHAAQPPLGHPRMAACCMAACGLHAWPRRRCEVTVISTSDSKKDEALKRLGAQHFINSRNADAMKVRGAVQRGSALCRAVLCWPLYRR